ncbi:MAG: DUF1207 domain-containing protein [Bacteroidia bacterium]
MPKRLVILTVLFSIISSANADSIYFKFIALPPTHIIPVFTPDARAHQSSALYTNKDNVNEIINSFGGVFPLVKVKSKYLVGQLSLAGTVYSTLITKFKSGYTLNNDYHVDIFFDVSLTRNFKMRLGSGHQSHHLSDDAIRRQINTTVINYVKDYFITGLVYVSDEETIYGLLHYFHSFKSNDTEKGKNFSGMIMLQGGIEKNVYRFNKYINAYAGLDVKLRQELNFGSTQNLQAGIKWQNNNLRNIRFVINFISGYDERGQYYKQIRNLVNSGIILQF